MAGRMPHKVRKLVVNGLKDSGKTTWASISLGIIPMKFVASVTQEAQFSLSMINEDTLLVFLDEWSHRTLTSDMAKGGSSTWFHGPGHKAWKIAFHFTSQLTSCPILEMMM